MDASGVYPAGEDLEIQTEGGGTLGLSEDQLVAETPRKWTFVILVLNLRREFDMTGRTPEYSAGSFNPQHVAIKAHWLAWKYGIDEQRVIKILDRTVIREGVRQGDDGQDRLRTSDLVYLLRFKPSFEDALLYLQRDVALKMFESADLKQVDEWLQATHQLARRYVDSNALYDCRRMQDDLPF